MSEEGETSNRRRSDSSPTILEEPPDSRQQNEAFPVENSGHEQIADRHSDGDNLMVGC